MADGFLGRWSQRKQALREGKPLAEAPVGAPLASIQPDLEQKQPEVPVQPSLDATNSIAESKQEAEPLMPTLDDARALTPQSDFAPFMARGVAPEVKNAAMKKLFADPHFNVMDMMDVYVDDYSQSTPIPESMLRQMVSAQFLDLFDEQKNKDAAAAAAAGTGDDADKPDPQTVAQSPHDDPDLRLQPDDAAGPEGPGPGAG